MHARKKQNKNILQSFFKKKKKKTVSRNLCYRPNTNDISRSRLHSARLERFVDFRAREFPMVRRDRRIRLRHTLERSNDENVEIV